MLQNINKKLGIGKIYIHKNTALFRITKYEELQELFNILEIKPLNTTKYLNYLAFKEALLENKKAQNIDLSLSQKSLILNKIRMLKNSMNTLRTDFILPDYHKIIITPYWLLGFVEGDGSFSISSSQSFPLRFNIVQSINEKKVLEAIKLFLLNLCTKGESNLKLKTTNSIQIIEGKESKLSENRKILLNLNINNHLILIQILVPFFNKLYFLTKKELDYKDWRNILELKNYGWHLSEEGSNLIIEISKHMNNNRLSSNIKNNLKNVEPNLDTNSNYNLILKKVKDLLNKPSNFEIYPDGKVFIKSEQKFWKGRSNIEIEVYNKEGLFLYSFDNLKMAAKFFKVDEHIIKYRLNSGKSFLKTSSSPLEPNKEIYFKRAINLNI